MNRFVIIGAVTLLMLLIIIFYNPNKKYLNIYKDSITISNTVEDGYNWSYELSSNKLKIKDTIIEGESIKWNFTPESDGTVSITYTYKKENEEEEIYKIKYDFKVVEEKIYWIKGESTGTVDFPNPE